MLFNAQKKSAHVCVHVCMRERERREDRQTEREHISSRMSNFTGQSVRFLLAFCIMLVACSYSSSFVIRNRLEVQLDAATSMTDVSHGVFNDL